MMIRVVLSIALLSSPVVLPIAAVILSAFKAPADSLFLSTMPMALLTSLGLMLTTTVLTCIIGCTAAWFITVYSLPAKPLLDLLLILPLALPAYIVSFAYTEFFDNVTYFLWLHSSDQETPPLFFQFRSFPGAVWVLSITLFPYVYIFTRAALLTRLGVLLDVSRLYALSPVMRIRLLFPLLRRGVLIGAALVMMEVLTDYGLAEYYGLNTLAKTMFDSWFGLHDPLATTQLASCMVALAVLLLLLEQRSRAASVQTMKHIQPCPHDPGRPRAIMITVALVLPFTFGFAAPLAVFFYQGFNHINLERIQDLGITTLQTFLIATVITALTLGIGGALYQTLQAVPRVLRQSLIALFSCGYAIPGMVFALGSLMALGTVDRLLVAFFGENTTWLPLFTGTLGILIFAAVGRFFAIGLAAYGHAAQAIPMTLRYTARLLPAGQGWRRFVLFWPMQKPALQAAFILILLDYIKELPMTLILRPFGIETLAVSAFAHAQSEQVAHAAPEALAMAGLCAIALVVLCLRPGYRDPFGALPSKRGSGTSLKQPRIQTS